MLIKKITVKNFRNYKSETVELCDFVNIFTGKNASGKTNFLESIYLLGVGKSPRTSKERELIKFGEQKAFIKAIVQKKYRNHTIELMLEGNGKKIFIDGLPINKLSDLIGVLNVIYFSPDELRFIKETPLERRRFLDISLSQQNKIYFHSLIRYNKILAQRNKLLKTDNHNPSLFDMLSIWDTQLCEAGANIILARQTYIKNLQSFAKDIHLDLTTNLEQIELSYESVIESTTREDIVTEFSTKLIESFEKDKSLMYTCVGPHRDDIKITLNGNDARRFASQGQQRTTALSIKIAELNLFKKETGESPILLLDDVLSELDETRRQKLFEQAHRTQTLITCTDFDFNVTDLTKIFTVNSGKISPLS